VNAMKTTAMSPTPALPPGPVVDLTALSIPIIAINGAFDSPYAKTHRLWHQAKVFQNVILPGKTHLTAIAVGGPNAAAVRRHVEQIHRHVRRALKNKWKAGNERRLWLTVQSGGHSHERT
jgi:hypothetical protein